MSVFSSHTTSNVLVDLMNESCRGAKPPERKTKKVGRAWSTQALPTLFLVFRFPTRGPTFPPAGMGHVQYLESDGKFPTLLARLLNFILRTRTVATTKMERRRLALEIQRRGCNASSSFNTEINVHLMLLAPHLITQTSFR